MRILTSVLILLIASYPAVACEFFGGAMPGACPPEATIGWWNGSWATREVDKSGKTLTAFTTLNTDGTYRTTLAYDAGGRLQHWGQYKIHVKSDLANSFSEQD